MALKLSSKDSPIYCIQLMNNDMKRISILSVVLVLGLIMFTGCSNDDEAQLTGIVSGLVTDAETGAPLENVVIVVFDANNNSPTSNIIHSDADGNYNIELPL
jgi:hypothetical protein